MITGKRLAHDQNGNSDASFRVVDFISAQALCQLKNPALLTREFHTAWWSPILRQFPDDGPECHEERWPDQPSKNPLPVIED